MQAAAGRGGFTGRQQHTALGAGPCPCLRRAQAVFPNRCRALKGFGGFGKQPAKEDCPCGSQKQYADCCGPQHKLKGPSNSASPEAVLRARYSAWCKGNVKYLKRTCHPKNPCLKGSRTAEGSGVDKHCSYEEDVAVTLAAVKFESLAVLGSSSDAGSAGKAQVDYQVTIRRRIDSSGAKIKEPAPEVIGERAQFVQNEQGAWLLLDTQPLAAVPAP